LTFGETNVDVIVDAGHPYDNSISALAKDKFVFNLTMTNGYVNIALQSQPSFNKVYGQNNIDKIESEFLAPSDGVYDFNINTPESVVINGTVSVQRLTTTATASVLYYEFGLGLAAASFLFIFYGVILRFETFYPFNK
jgi:hypothetical protein